MAKSAFEADFPMQQGGDLSRSYAGSFIPTFTHALVAQYDAKRAVFYAPYVSLSYLFHFVVAIV